MNFFKVFRYTVLVFNKPLNPTQPGYPFIWVGEMGFNDGYSYTASTTEETASAES